METSGRFEHGGLERAISRGANRDIITSRVENIPNSLGNPTITDGPRLVQVCASRNPRKYHTFLQDFLGNVRLKSTVNERMLLDPEDVRTLPDNCMEHYAYENVCVIYPAEWLAQKFRVHVYLRTTVSYPSCRGWRHTLKVCFLVPKDAVIFKSCQEGNIPPAMPLAEGHALSRDTDSFGSRPMRVSPPIPIKSISNICLVSSRL